MNATAYPLDWPEHFPRSKWREDGRFKTTLAAALSNVQGSLRCFATDSGKTMSNVVLSSNCTLGVNSPADPGVAAWFTWDGLQVCIPVDRYKTPAANLQAIHHVIEARRVELRHGTLALVHATMKGFAALPAPGSTPWWQTLKIDATANKEQIEAAYKRLARERHPDAGGSEALMSELNVARDKAMRQL